MSLSSNDDKSEQHLSSIILAAINISELWDNCESGAHAVEADDACGAHVEVSLLAKVKFAETLILPLLLNECAEGRCGES